MGWCQKSVSHNNLMKWSLFTLVLLFIKIFFPLPIRNNFIIAKYRYIASKCCNIQVICILLNTPVLYCEFISSLKPGRVSPLRLIVVSGPQWCTATAAVCSNLWSCQKDLDLITALMDGALCGFLIVVVAVEFWDCSDAECVHTFNNLRSLGFFFFGVCNHLKTSDPTSQLYWDQTFWWVICVWSACCENKPTVKSKILQVAVNARWSGF